MAGNFALDISKWVEKATGNTKAVVQRITQETFQGVLYKTPVDTGHLRENWGVQTGGPYTGYNPDAKGGSLQATIGKIQSGVAAWDAKGLITMCNNTKYAPRIEYDSWSKQYPAGMVRVTAAEIVAKYGGK